MEDLKTQQLEALKVAYDYVKKLESSIATVLDELRVEKKEDTDEFLQQIINGVNWTIEVTNGTMTLLNEDKIRIEKEHVNDEMIALGNALKAKDDLLIADRLEKGVLPFLGQLKAGAKEIASIEEN